MITENDYYFYFISFYINDLTIDDIFNEDTIENGLLINRFKNDYDEIKSLGKITADGEIYITTDCIDIYNLIKKNNQIKHNIRLII